MSSWDERTALLAGLHPENPNYIDTKYAPRVGPDQRIRKDIGDYRPEAAQGQAALVRVNGWTVLAYWDRSGDSRPNSNSAFAAKGDHSFDDMIAAAEDQYPWVFERQTFDVVLAPSTDRDSQCK